MNAEADKQQVVNAERSVMRHVNGARTAREMPLNVYGLQKNKKKTVDICRAPGGPLMKTVMEVS